VSVAPVDIEFRKPVGAVPAVLLNSPKREMIASSTVATVMDGLLGVELVPMDDVVVASSGVEVLTKRN
jgi:hypothetical protein